MHCLGYAQATLLSALSQGSDCLQHLPSVPYSHRYLLQLMDYYQLARQLSGDVDGTRAG